MCLGMIMSYPQKKSGQNGVGRLNTSLTVCASSASTRSRSCTTPRRGEPVAGSDTYSQLNTTSSAMKGCPSCQVTPCFSYQVTDRPSFATPPLSTVGISRARIGISAPSASKEASGS